MNKLISDIRNKHGTTDPYQLADKLGIIINSSPLGQCHGYYLSVMGVQIIRLNSDDSEAVNRYTLAHELGHYYLHADANFFALRDSLFASGWQERQADKFAIHLLLTDDMLRENPQYTIDNWASILGIERESVELRFQ